jgi:hypothetical protein
MEKNAVADKPFTMNAHVRERFEGAKCKRKPIENT